jgi:hypothetical protein
MTAQPHPLAQRKMPDGSMLWMREVDFDVVVEPWTRYTLKDGGTLRHRSTCLRVFQIYEETPMGPTPKIDENGEPFYFAYSYQQTVYGT